MRIILSVILCFALFVEGITQSKDEVDSLLRKLEASKGEERIRNLHLLIINTWLNYPVEAMKYADEAIEFSVKIDHPALYSKSVRLKGGVHNYLGNYDSTIFYSQKSLEIATSIRDTALISNALNNTGLAYLNTGNYQNALENLLRALNLKVLNGEIYGRAININNIGLVYNKLKDYEQARDYFNRALDFARKHDTADQQLYSLNNIAGTYLAQGNLDKAEEYFEKSANMQVINKNWNAVTISGLAQVYMHRNEFDKSKAYFGKALSLRNEIGDRHGVSEIYFFYAKEDQLKQRYDSSLYWLGKSQQIAKEIGSRERKYENIELYVDIYSELGQIEKAFTYQNKLLGLRDTLFNENMARNMADIQLKIQKEEAQALLSSKDQELVDNKRITLFLVIIIILTITILMIILVAYRQNRKINKKLAYQNNEINAQKEEIVHQKESLIEKNVALERAQKLIEKQNQKLEAYNEQLLQTVDERTQELEERNQELKMANLELDNFIYKSSHDIKGPLATLLGVCNVALLDIKDEKPRSYFRMLSKTAKGLNDILARLKTVSDINSLELKIKKIDFEKIIKNCLDQVRNIEGLGELNVKYSIEQNIIYFGDPFLIDIIIFNMLQNAIKFQDRNKKDLVEVKVEQDSSHLIMHFTDNGIGIEEDEADSIFQMFSKSALKHQSLGLGLYLVKQCVQKLSGEIMLVNDDNDLTHFRISLPKT